MYAMVNVEQYNMVVTAESQGELFSKYKKLLASSGGANTGDISEKKAEVTVDAIEYITMEGETYVYIKDTEGNVYKMLFADDESVIKISAGDRIGVQYIESEDGIHTLVGIESGTR